MGSLTYYPFKRENTMGHIYEKLGERVDRMQVRTPWDQTFHEILKELYTPEEAELIVSMPYGMSELKRVGEITGMEEGRLKGLLDSLCHKGLVMDLRVGDKTYYTASPLIVGIFEFTMMRTGGDLDRKKISGLFNEYIDEKFFAANCGPNDNTSVMRTLPHEEMIHGSARTEVLDYESAMAMTEESDRFAIGLCSCRHKKHHLGEKDCEVPLEKCSTFGRAADYLIRNDLAREVSKARMLENIEESKEMGLVLNADNVQKDITYMCHCCKDCCMALNGISKYGYPKTIVTSGFIAQTDHGACIGCGKCAKACAIDCIGMEKDTDPATKRKKRPEVDRSVCLGCGVCALKCEKGAMRLVRREKRVIPPERSFERVILMHLEKGNLGYQLFDNPHSVGQSFMRAFVGGFLRLSPVKRALASDTLRSGFLNFMKTGVRRQGKGYLLDI